MKWYNKAFISEKSKDKINNLPRIENYLPDETVDYTTELDVIFTDYFQNYSNMVVDQSIKDNPANIQLTPKNIYAINYLASFHTEGSYLNEKLYTPAAKVFSAALARPFNFLTSLFTRESEPAFVPSQLRSRGGSTISSRKPNTKNKKTKKLIRDKR